MPDVADGEQLLFFDPGTPKRVPPTEDELSTAVQWAARMRIFKDYRGRPPRDWNWDDLNQAVQLGALKRLRNFRHGGEKTLHEYASMAAYYTLMEICREHMVRPVSPREYPLFESIA